MGYAHMNRTLSFGLVSLIIVCLTVLLGCQQRPAVPTTAPQPTEPVVVVVVTATSQPTLAPTQTTEATITPLPSLTVAVTDTVTATLRATSVAKATRPPATTGAPKPTAAAQATNAPAVTAAPSNFPAPVAFAPEGKAFRDGDTVKFEFSSVGQLTSDQCYRFDMTLGNPTGPGGVGDYWVGLCGNQSSPGDRLIFNLKAGRFRDSPNYGTLLISADSVIPPTPQYTMRWTVSVVKVVNGADPVHPQVQGLSPASAALENSFFR